MTGRFCSSIEAPINKNYRVGEDDFGSMWLVNRDNNSICDGVERLWDKEDTIFVLCEDLDYKQDRIIKKYSLYAFPSQSETYDEICLHIDRGPMNSILRDRGLQMEESITPKNYLHKVLLIPYIIEGVFRHSLVILLLVYLWVKTIRRAKRKKESQDEHNEQRV